MADFVATLVEMGFPLENATKAVAATGNVDVQSAMEWLLNNADVSAVSEVKSHEEGANGNNKADPATAGGTPGGTEEAVRSYKCNDCDKVLRNEAEMELHAAKTKHSNFSESTEEKKPLTEEEKKEQLRLIDEKLRIKRAEREEREKQEGLEREKLRMKSGKELADYKRKFEEQQMKELVESRRREKLEDKQARDRVKAQIEADRQARKDKDSGKLPADVHTLSSPSVTSSASTISSTSSVKANQDEPPKKKDYTETKLQLRLPNGKQLVQSFNVKEPLAAVRLYVQLNRDDGISTPFNLMTNFPRKTFEGGDYDVPLDALGLVPSAVLMITKTV